jgi:hypothetical protein
VRGRQEGKSRARGGTQRGFPSRAAVRDSGPPALPAGPTRAAPTGRPFGDKLCTPAPRRRQSARDALPRRLPLRFPGSWYAQRSRGVAAAAASRERSTSRATRSPATQSVAVERRRAAAPRRFELAARSRAPGGNNPRRQLRASGRPGRRGGRSAGLPPLPTCRPVERPPVARTGPARNLAAYPLPDRPSLAGRSASVRARSPASLVSLAEKLDRVAGIVRRRGRRAAV